MTSQTAEQTPEVIAKEIAADRAQRRDERRALIAIPASDLANSPSRTSFVPQSMGEAMQLATVMSRSSFVPVHCRGSEGNCLAIVMQASRWGMDPFAVANKAYFVRDGAPPAFEAQLVNAVVNSSGALSGRLRIAFEGEGESLRCTVRGFLRADPNDEKVRTQSIARITTRNSPLWKSDPEQQLGYYTTRAWARMHCPEVLLGVYTPDEVEVEPERARVVSPERPRRAIAQDTIYTDTSEVLTRDSRGMTEVDEETARALDAGEAIDEAQRTVDMIDTPLDQRWEGEPEAEYYGSRPTRASAGERWWDRENGKLRYARDTESGIKWYLNPPQPQPEPDANDGTLSADNPAAAEGKAGEDRGEAPSEPAARPMWQDAVDKALAGCRGAGTIGAINAVDNEWQKHVVAVPESQAQRVNDMIDATRRELRDRAG